MQDTQLYNDRLVVTFRESLYSLFHEKVRKEMDDSNCTYFAHNIIKNYYKPGHTVSSFYTHSEWQQEYWNKHWNSDILSHKIHQIAEKDGFAISSWDFIDPKSEVMNRRKSVCQLDDGVQFTFKHDDGTLENYSFGWKNVKGKKMGFEKLLKLSDLVGELRDTHFRLFSESTSDPSDEK